MAVATVRIDGEQEMVGEVADIYNDEGNDNSATAVIDQDTDSTQRMKRKLNMALVKDTPAKKTAIAPPVDIHIAPSNRAIVAEDESFSKPRHWVKTDFKACHAASN